MLVAWSGVDEETRPEQPPGDGIAPLATTMPEIQALNISDTSSIMDLHGLHSVAR